MYDEMAALARLLNRYMMLPVVSDGLWARRGFAVESPDGYAVRLIDSRWVVECPATKEATKEGDDGVLSPLRPEAGADDGVLPRLREEKWRG